MAAVALEKDMDKLNGSVSLLATALRDVITEVMDASREASKADLDAVVSVVSSDLASLRSDNAMTNQNMQTQFAQVREDIAQVTKG